MSLPTPSADAAALNLVPDLVTPERGFEEVTWEHTLDEGQHLVFHYRSETYSRGIVQIVNGTGHEVLHSYSTSLQHYISDGRDGSGDVRYKAIGADPLSVWLRGDIALNGSTYTYHVEDRAPVQAQTFTNATTGSFGDASQVLATGKTVETARERHMSAGADTHAFRTAPAQTPWTRYQTGGSMEVEQVSGHLSRTRLVLEAPGTVTDVTSIAAPAPSGSFIAEASFQAASQNAGRVTQSVDHQAVLSGINGSDVQWALVMASIDLDPSAWSLFFIDEAGTRTQVAPTWTQVDPYWHTVQAYVDPQSGTVEVQVDDASQAKRFEGAFDGGVDSVATGDIWDDRILWTGGGMAFYDNLAIYPVDAAPPSTLDDASIQRELLWYTPHDAPWSDWTVEAGSPPTIVEESWGPTLALGSGTDDPSLVSPELGDWDRLVTWFRPEAPGDADNAALYEALDDQGEVLFHIGIQDGVLEAWDPGTEISIDRLPGHILGSVWYRLTFLQSPDGVEVRLGGGTLDIPLDPGDEVAALRVVSTGDGHTTWQLAGLRVTQGPVLDESFDLPTLDPRLTLEHPEHDGGIDHRTTWDTPPSRGSLWIEGSAYPGERALAAAPVDATEPLIAETTFRLSNAITHTPDHPALLGGLGDDDGMPGDGLWAVTVSPLWMEEARTDPSGIADALPGLDEPLGLYLDTGDDPPVLLETLDGEEAVAAHTLTAELDPTQDALTVSLDRQPLASATVDLDQTAWIGIGDLSEESPPLLTRTGDTRVPVYHGELFIAGIG